MIGAPGVYQVEVLVTGGALPLVTFTSEQVICDGTPVWKQPGHRQFSLATTAILPWGS